MEPFLLMLLVLAVFIGAWLLVNSFINAQDQEGELTVKERTAVVFEVYRYAVCFMAMLFFGVMGYLSIAALFTGGMENPQALVGPGIGVLISVAIFLLHWRMKNPSLA